MSESQDERNHGGSSSSSSILERIRPRIRRVGYQDRPARNEEVPRQRSRQDNVINIGASNEVFRAVIARVNRENRENGGDSDGSSTSNSNDDDDDDQTASDSDDDEDEDDEEDSDTVNIDYGENEDNDDLFASDDDDDSNDEENDMFVNWRHLADIRDWSEIRAVMEKGPCQCHRSEFWTDVMKTIGYIVNKYYKNKHGGRSLGRSYPKKLVHDLIFTAVSMSADQGQSVLTASHALCCDDNQDSSLTLEVLLDWFSDKFGSIDMRRLLFDTTKGQGYNAIDQCWKRCMWNYPGGTLEFPLSSRLSIDSEHVKIAMKKTKMMTEAVFESSLDNIPFSLLNALLMSPCPNVAVHAALLEVSNRAQCHKFDENDNLPLHLAAMNPVHHELVGAVSRDDEPLHTVLGTSAIQALLDVYPRAARTANSQGRVPLNLVLENYHKWKKDQAKRGSQRDCCAACGTHLTRPLDDTILKLVRAAPEALQARDQKMHMYPFMMAASNKAVPLDLVYSLLRANPLAVQCGIKQTHYETYLEKKLDQAILHQQGLQEQLDQKEAELNRLKRKRGQGEEQETVVEERNHIHNASIKREKGMYGWFASFF